MKKLIDKIGYETFWGGIFGIIAIAAAIISTILGGVDGSAIWGCIKDVAGTMVVIMLLFASLPRFAKNFKEALQNALSEVVDKYSPLIKPENSSEETVLYKIANNTNCIFNEPTGKYNKFFEYNFKTNQLLFYISEGIFITSKKLQKINIEDIKMKFVTKINEKHSDTVTDCRLCSEGIKLDFKSKPSTIKDAESIKEIVDEMVVFYLAQSKKGEKININED